MLRACKFCVERVELLLDVFQFLVPVDIFIGSDISFPFALRGACYRR